MSEVEEIILPAVPLNVPIAYTLNLSNDGYQNSLISASIVAEEVSVPLTVEFIGGNTIGISNPRLKVSIVFQSPAPISFTAKIVFEDD